MPNGNDAGSKNYFFFLSYFRRDAKDNPWFKQFYDDLTRDVASRASVPVDTPDEDIRFYDREAIETGDVWFDTLAEGLQTSRVFVPFYSPGYFTSEYCGKEFHVFRAREREYENRLAAGAARPRLIIPIMWKQPQDVREKIPKSISSIQYADASLGEMYAQMGLEYLLRMEEKREYQKFLMAMANKIVKEVENHTLPRASQITPLAEVCNEFISPTIRGGVGVVPAAAKAPEAAGPDVAWFVYVAGSPSAFNGANITRSHTCYGQFGGHEWQPYLPGTRKKIGVIAASVASEREVLPQLLSVGETFIEELQKAEENNTIVVLIIDPWSLPLYTTPLNSYDMTRLSNCGVIVLWNDNDPETQQRRQGLDAKMRQIFSRTLISRDVFFKESNSESDLREKLGEAIDDVSRKISDRSRLVRGPVDDTGGSIPKLPVPSRDNATVAPSTGGAK